MGSRENILKRLSIKTGKIKVKTDACSNLHVVPDLPDSPEEMLARFIVEAEKLSCKIHQVDDDKSAVDVILRLISGEKKILGWAFEEIGLANFEKALTESGIQLEQSADPEVRYGITGVEVALAATGSIILTSDPGKVRAASLLPPVHIAVLRSNQIVKDLENQLSPVGKERNIFQERSNIVVISGPSKTADIAMELVMGMHGPQELHLVLVH